MKRIVAGVVGLLFATAAFTHVPDASPRGGAPGVVACLITSVVLLYAFGLTRLWTHSRERVALLWRATVFGTGCAMLGVLLLGPLDAAAPRSFALHMLQHEGLMLLAAPLLVLGRPMPLFLWALPHEPRLALGRVLQSSRVKSSWHWLTAPLTAWVAHALALWLWHAPPLFNAAVTDGALHEWQHVTFLLSALLFWHAVTRRGTHGAQGMALLYLFTTTVHTGVLGALITFARQPLYVSMQQGLTPWLGLTPLEDQQLGGLIMWVPGALVYVGAALWLLARWVGPEHSSLAR